MIYFPPLRRLLLPAIIFLAVVVVYRSVWIRPASLPFAHQVVFTPINATEPHLLPPSEQYYSHSDGRRLPNSTLAFSKPIDNSALHVLWQCPVQANRFTNHIRISAIMRNITHIPPEPLKPEKRIFWNPTIISLPYWSENQYLLVSRIVTAGNHQENVICEANVCYVGSAKDAKPGEQPCTEDDLKLLGPAGGMRCASAPLALNVPPTPAEKCHGRYENFVDVPGFHDPRIFWSGKGEPLMMLNTQ